MSEENVPNNWEVSAKNFIGTLMVNVENEKLSDADFREFVKNTIEIVEKPDFENIANEGVKKRIRKFYA